MVAKIPATVVTGFLGAGKTSLIQHMLRNANGRRIALIVNEFGDLGIDGSLIAGCGIPDCEDGDVVELTNGCICCTVADDFLPTIQGLLDRPNPPEHIVIETSGLALPKPLLKAFSWPEVRTRTTVDGVVAVVDCAAVAAGRFAPDPDAVQAQRLADDALDHESPLEELFEDQLHCADLVLLNKTDLISTDTLEKVQAEVAKHLRPGVSMVAAERGSLDPLVALGLDATAEADLESRKSHHDDHDEHDHDDFTSTVVQFGAVSDPEDLQGRLERLLTRHGVLRVKGFVAVDGKPMRLVYQGVGDRVERYFDRPWTSDEPRQSHVVVIGESGLDMPAIEAELRA